jgi:class 3 adenylate cyclase
MTGVVSLRSARRGLVGTWVEDLEDGVDSIFGTAWNEREGRVIPETSDVALKDGAVKLEAAFLYADLAGSSRIAKLCPWGTTAKIIRAYLDVSTRLIRGWKGEIRSFDGDRVMGVFIGDNKNTAASQCAREIDYSVEKIINPKARKAFKSVRDNDIKIRHCVGIDVGLARAVRAGIRNSNDLVWIGKAPSFAAKLSDVRDYPYSVYTSARTYKNNGDETGSDGASIWEKATCDFAGESETVYKTKVMKTP